MTLLLTINFFVQLTVDIISPRLIRTVGYRASIISAHIFATIGIFSLSFLPHIITPYVGILISVIIYAVGGGIIEVLISPIIEYCPTDNKEKMMSLLHSFYCWGQVLVVLLSTIFFNFFSIENWPVLAIIWSLLPLCNIFLFAIAPIEVSPYDANKHFKYSNLFKETIFWILIVMMLCSGASELAVSQWASAFAENGLGITKTLGDLLGPMAFAVLMGISRLIFGRFGDKHNLDLFMIFSSSLCVASYLLITLSSSPTISLIGCAICGFSVGIMWPGTYSKAASSMKYGGTALFALLALAGDLGCMVGPSIVGNFADKLGFKTGILTGITFPTIMLICIIIICNKKERKN